MTRLLLVAASLALIVGCQDTSTSVSNLPGGGKSIRLGGMPFTQGSGLLAVEDRPVGTFTGINASTGIEVIATVSDDTSVQVEADDNLIPLITTEVIDDVLHVKVVGSLSTKNPIKVILKTRELTRVVATSGARIEASKLNGETWKVTVNSGASVIARGSVASQTVDASSGASYQAKELETDTTTVDASSGASVTVSVLNRFVGSVASGARVKYSGKPEHVTTSSSSGGLISRE